MFASRNDAAHEQARLCRMYGETVFILRFFQRDERVYAVVLESEHDARNDDLIVAAQNPDLPSWQQ